MSMTTASHPDPYGMRRVVPVFMSMIHRRCVLSVIHQVGTTISDFPLGVYTGFPETPFGSGGHRRPWGRRRCASVDDAHPRLLPDRQMRAVGRRCQVPAVVGLCCGHPLDRTPEGCYPDLTGDPGPHIQVATVRRPGQRSADVLARDPDQLRASGLEVVHTYGVLELIVDIRETPPARGDQRARPGIEVALGVQVVAEEELFAPLNHRNVFVARKRQGHRHTG